MSLTPGTRLGAYEVVGPLGAGGRAALNHPNVAQVFGVDGLEAAHERGIDATLNVLDEQRQRLR